MYFFVKTRNRLFSFLLVGLFLVFVSGCGFHLKGLQGVSNADTKTVFAVYENVSADFHLVFQQLLKENTQQAMDAKSANVKLVFLKESCQRRSLTVTDTGIPAEYRFSCTIRYRSLEDGVEKVREVIESRDFKSNNAQLLAVESQQAFIKHQIQQRMAWQVVRYLSLSRP